MSRVSNATIRPAFSTWPRLNRRLRDVVAAMTDEQLALRPGPGRWPIWATVGHLACQRVFWLCDFAGAPGAATTPFTNAAYDCPGDDDLEPLVLAGGHGLPLAGPATAAAVHAFAARTMRDR